MQRAAHDLDRSDLAHRRFEGLRFDWRSAPREDTLPWIVWGRGAIIAALLALWIAMAVAWGWAAGMAFGFVVAIALVRMAGVILGGTLIRQAGRSYYERQLRGRRRAP
jgi:fatty acid desaturase